MRPLALAAALLVGLGVVLLACAASLGEVTVMLVLVVPVLVGTGPWSFLGGLLLLGGLVAAFWAWASRGAPEVGGARAPEPRGRGSSAPPQLRATRRTGAGGFILVGPIPIAFGSTRALAATMLLLALAALALVLVLPSLLRGSP